MRSIEVCFVVATALAPMAGAAGQETVGPTGIRTLIRDSAGIRIIENARPPEGSRLDWRLGPEPLVSIGRMVGEDPYLFHRVFGAAVLSDGRIVIGDDGPKELRVFDGSGNHLETWGGQGEGPGEFGGNQLWGMAVLPGDSIIVWHFWYPELTVFGPDGKLVRRFIPERSRWNYWGDRRSHLWPLTVSLDGLILAGQDDVYIDPAEVEVWDAGGGLRGSLGAHPGRESFRRGDDDPGPVMFGRSVRRHIWGDLFGISSNHRYEFRAFALDGSMARIVRMEHELREPTDAHVEAYIGERLAMYPSERTDLAEQRRRMQSMPVAEHLPAFAAVRGDDALGHLWVYEYEAPGEEEPGTLITIFDPEGRVLGFFEVPEGMWILEIGADYILARVENDLGVHSVQLWPLERGGQE